MGDNLHAGHRKRLRDEFMSALSDTTMPDHKLLELLLFYSIPRKDTNELAHTMLNRFGSFSALLDASPEELMSVDGITENSVVLLKLIIPIYRRYNIGKIDKVRHFDCMDSFFQYIINRYCGITREVFALSSFNAKGDLIGFDVLNRGDLSVVGISTRSVLEAVIRRKAAAVVLSHNHPGGTALPSREDVDCTSRIDTALQHIGVSLLDHVIVADSDCVSLSQSAAYRSLFTCRRREDAL